MRLERLLAPAVLVVGLLLSGWAAWQQGRNNAREVAEATRDLATRVVDRATSQLGRAALNLRGVRAYLVGAGVDDVSSAQFRAFAQSHDVQRAAPGVVSVGVIRRVAPAHEAAFVARMQREGNPAFQRRALGPHGGERRIVQWIEPAESNRGVAGVDVNSEDSRRRASDLALQTDDPILTAPIQLSNRAADAPLGLLMMLRMPAGAGAPGLGIASGPAALVYSRIALDELMRADELRSDLLSIAVADVSAPAGALDFRLQVAQPDALRSEAALTLERSVMGRAWRFTVTPRAAFIDSLHQVSPQMLGARLVSATLLLALLAHLWARLRLRTREGLAERTRLLSMLDHASDAVVGLDLQGRVMLWNHAAERLFDYRASEAMGRPLADMTLALEQAGEDAHLIREAAAGRATAPFETRRRHRDGTMLDVELSAGPMYDDTGRVVGVVKLLRAVHERVEQRRQLQAWGERLETEVAARTRQLAEAADDLRQVLDAMPSKVSAWDSQLRNRFANRASAEQFGRTPAQLVGMAAEDLLEPARFAQDRPQMLAALAGRACQFEHRVVQANGLVSHALVNFVPRHEGGQVVGFYALLHDISEIKRAQQRLEDIIEGTEAGTWEWDLSTGKVVFNERWGASLGLRPADLQNATTALWQQLAHPDDQALAIDRMRAHVHGNTPAFECETRMRHRDGHWLWIQTRGKVVARAADGRPLALAGIHLDITERKQAEQALRDSQAMLARTGEIAQIGGWAYDLDTRTPRWSDETCRIHGLPPGHQPTLDEAFAYYTDEARPQIQALVERALQTHEGWDVELPIQRADGRQIWVRAQGEAECVGGQVLRLVGSLQDISAQRAAREAAEHARRLMLAAVDAVDEAFAVYGPDDRLVLCNEKYRSLYGMLADVLQPGARFEDIIRAGALRGQYTGAADRVEDWVAERLAQHRLPHSTLTQELHDGRILRIVERHLPDGHVVGFRVDITELERARRAAESASRAKTEFLANTSHEIRTPLNGILGLAYLLERSALPPEQLAQARQIAQAGRALLALINDVLDLSKIEAGQLEIDPQDLDLRKLCGDAMGLLAAGLQAKHLHTAVTVDPAVPAWVRGDGTRLRQILHNLLGNALKFTDQGSVGLHIRPGSSPGWIDLQVCDTGIGIDAPTQARLFQPFMQADASTSRRYGGTGLGLSIVARLVALMGGQIRLDSQPGSGSSFTVALPLPALASGTPPPAPAPGRPGDAPPRVLLCEADDAERARVLGLAHALGWQCQAVDGFQTLLEAAQHAADLGHPYDALVVDWHAPDRPADAPGLLGAALTGPAPAPGLVLAGAPAEAAAALATHGAVLLPKPVQASALFNAVNQVAAAQPGLAGLAHDTDNARLPGQTILVVDDNALNLEVARKVLELEDARIVTCNSGEQALLVLQDPNQDFDAVLLDIEMPGMDGITVAQRLRSMPQAAQLPVIALSAGVLREDRDRAMAAGMSDFMRKPLEPERLIAGLRQHIGRYRGQPVPVQRRRAPGQVGPAAAALDIDGLDAAQITSALLADQPLVLSMLRRLLDEQGRIVGTPADQLPARLHKLRGSALVLGATAVARDAAALEWAVQHDHQADHAALTLALQGRLDALGRAAARPLQAEAQRLAALHAAQASAALRDEVPLDDAALQALAALVDSQSVRAAAQVDVLAGPIVARWGAAHLARLRDALGEFDFQTAAGLLQR